MLGNINSSDANERRPSAERLLIQQRLSEIDIATRSEHDADLRSFPNLITPSVQPLPAVVIPEGVVSNVINLANQREARVMSEHEQRLALIRADIDALTEVDYEAAA